MPPSARPQPDPLPRLAVLTIACVATLAAGIPSAAKSPPDSEAIRFERQIRPVLAEHCLACHGPDAAQRKADLRLDQRDHVLELGERDEALVVPGAPEKSELFRRIASSDPDERMPPPAAGEALTPDELELVRQWIAQGASWQEHWAYRAPERPALPAPTSFNTSEHSPPLNAIDLFTHRAMARHALSPARPADRRTLIRRVTLDLLGLPPTPAEIDAFLNDDRPDAYERLVDRLLASPRYGERMAVPWLDLARYADTHGYHIDSHRDMWRWRDWVIQALNMNMPFDQFTIEQIAGDLLPDATLDQKLATGFLRNNMINFEGGAIAEEYLNEYLVDRVVTVSTAWLGQTMQCARCHDHKYDPFTQRDFYRLYALFNVVPEKGLDGRTGNAEPFLETPTALQRYRLNHLARRLSDLNAQLEQRAGDALQAQREWERQVVGGDTKLPEPPRDMLLYLPLDETDAATTVVNRASVATHSDSDSPDSSTEAMQGQLKGNPVWLAAGKFEGALLCDGETYLEFEQVADFDADQAFSYGAWIFPTTEDPLTVLSRMGPAPDLRGYDLFLNQGRLYVHLVHTWSESAIRVNSPEKLALHQWQHVMVTYDGSGKAAGVKLFVDGKARPLETSHDQLNGSIRTDQPLRIGRRAEDAGFRGMLDDVRIYPRQLPEHEVALLAGSNPILEIAKLPVEQRSGEQSRLLTRYFLENHDAVYRRLNRMRAEAERLQSEIRKQIPTTMVMSQMEQPRPTHILTRGDYQLPGEQVTAGVPESLPSFGGEQVSDRLKFARWLVHPDHPLTARVAVNRYWQLFFGEGLVRTPEDFGTRGQLPSHPELLDWLAREFVESGWDVKHLHRLIVTSATYRQSSDVTREHLAQDPGNVWLSRAPRLRLSAEMIRDNALAVSGLLHAPVGGPSVYPYQPPGLWEEVSFNPRDFTAQTYVESSGRDLYRRGMYSFWKRAVPPPALVAFDAPNRETCLARRGRTNTPLQALVLMNDPTFVEAARVFAESLLRGPPLTDRQRLTDAFERALGRNPQDREVEFLLGMLERYLAHYRAHPDEALALSSVGAQPAEHTDLPRVAAWTMICTTLLNLDEAIHRN